MGINPKTNLPYDDPNDVAIDMWIDESLSSLQYSPKPFIESGFDWISQGGLKDLLATDYKKTDFYLGKGKWYLTKPETAKWVTHDKAYPYAEKFKSSDPTQREAYICLKMVLAKAKCQVVDGKIQKLEVANYKGIEDWDKTKSQSKADTFNNSFKQLSNILVRKDSKTGAVADLTADEKASLQSTKTTDFYKLDYAGAFYRTRVGSIFLVILTPIFGALLIGANVFAFIKYRGGLQ